MKRILVAAAAAMSFAAPLALSSAAHADPRGHHRNYDRHDRGYDYRHDRRDDRRDYRQGYRDGRWDARRHNGYYLGNRWHYGPPPQAYYGRRDFRVDYRQWRRGDRLPAYYRQYYAPVDYRYHRLSAPPRGHHWVRSDRGEYLLVGIATGVILGLALAH
ncbi:MAG: RcnB family protein [Hyphomonadaceae bacterium]|nr:RcnB family protein [Hyphomonadaceae bacterium]